MIEINNKISKATDDFLLSHILQRDDFKIKTREYLQQCVFICPFCDKLKPAKQLNLLQSNLQIKRDGNKFTVSQKMGICCDECRVKLFPIKREG